jgi:hypothetical protein
MLICLFCEEDCIQTPSWKTRNAGGRFGDLDFKWDDNIKVYIWCVRRELDSSGSVWGPVASSFANDNVFL